MILGWLTERRRRRLAEAPFPADWDHIIDANVWLARTLDRELRERLRDLVCVFVDEKSFEGCGGLELTDEIKLTIAGQACLLLLGREHALFEDVESILVYPDAMVAPDRPPAIFERGDRVIDDAGTPVLGQAHLGGPVLLAWDDALAGGRGKGKRNVVLHEFAHKIDMADGTVDGTPPLDDYHDRVAWADICSRTFLRLRDQVESGGRSRSPRRVLDDYGATNEAEFFAVATETFFMRPRELADALPELFELLLRFYKFDPGPR